MMSSPNMSRMPSSLAARYAVVTNVALFGAFVVV